jgi:flavin reductase (DIM6/NTAB) family NADH-FMN oxidoreductase RutF
MFYDPDIKKSHGLPHDPFKSLVAPRPIGWISTVSADGHVNLAPYSFFNAVCYNPCIVMFSSSGLPDDPQKHSWRNAEETGEFVCNIVSEELKDQMNTTSAHVPRGVDEFELAGLTAEPSEKVKPPRVKESPAHLECKYLRTVEFESEEAHHTHGVIFGHVVGIHIRDDILTDGMVDTLKFRPVARLGYMEYTVVDNVFSMGRPDVKIPNAAE